MEISISGIDLKDDPFSKLKPVPFKMKIKNSEIDRVLHSEILSEAHSIYGLILTFLSGSIFYVIGFSLTAWTSLRWVRARFKQNLANIPSG